MRPTTIAVYRTNRRPNAYWQLGCGFDTWLARLDNNADSPPLDLADQQLAAHGLTRTSDWRTYPHHPDDGWMQADALNSLDHRPDLE